MIIDIVANICRERIRNYLLLNYSCRVIERFFFNKIVTIEYCDFIIRLPYFLIYLEVKSNTIELIPFDTDSKLDCK